ncbi:MAG: NeuD/PglB/VioB family sugar acetyltransferase [Chloroflexota bacterium]|nr:NeuD/PglB/VioB family sugar acetyltransferase [Chloroflexota bacterium]
MSDPVIFPLLNPNEPQALLAALFIEESQHVSDGDILCTLETTKSTAEMAAEKDGYIAGLLYRQGDPVDAGDILCYIANSPDWQPAQADVSAAELAGDALADDLRITQPALALAEKNGLDLDDLPRGPLVTERVLQSIIDKQTLRASAAAEAVFDPNAIIIYGGGGHGKSLIDLLLSLRTYQIHGIVDDGIPAGERVMGVPVLGDAQVLPETYSQGVRLAVNAVGGIGNTAIRVEVFRRLAEAGFSCPAVVHPAAFIEPSATLSAGVQVFPFAYVGSEVQAGYGAIINTSAVVSHECTLGAYSNVSPGALLAGGVQVGDAALIGMGATVNLGVRIGEGARIGNSAAVKADVPPNGVVRAGAVWPE